MLIAQTSHFILQAPRDGITKQQRESFACFFRYAKEELSQRQEGAKTKAKDERDVTTSKSGISPGQDQVDSKDNEHRIPDEASKMTEEVEADEADEADEEAEDDEDEKEETDDKEA